jgi:hypothetical protein
MDHKCAVFLTLVDSYEVSYNRTNLGLYHTSDPLSFMPSSCLWVCHCPVVKLTTYLHLFPRLRIHEDFFLFNQRSDHTRRSAATTRPELGLAVTIAPHIKVRTLKPCNYLLAFIAYIVKPLHLQTTMYGAVKLIKTSTNAAFVTTQVPRSVLYCN